MPLIDLLRHGETERHGLLLGRTDVALSEAGWQQLERQAASRTWSSIVTSPLRRSREPAEKLARLRGLPLLTDDDWAELDFGDWDGRPIAELRADPAIARQLDAFYRDAEAPGPPNGESWRLLCGRAARAIARLLKLETNGTVLVVSHAGPMRAALSIACAIPLEHTWAIRIDPGTRVTLHVEQDDGHLWGEIVEVVQP